MTSESIKGLSPGKRALLEIRRLKQQITELQRNQSAVSEPIAIVSMACRFPRRSVTPEAFWQSLVEGADEVGEIPADRWDVDAFHDDDPAVPGRMYARHGVFLENIDQMDPEFFGISPREATWVDPQQRLLLEVGWEALERAAWSPGRVGERTGIFVGWMHNDYQNEASDSFLNLNPYIATGAAGSFLCGRLAYSWGLHGPSVAVDTACSSSLVALHLACQSLQQRECDYALAGGVNVICSPTTNILTCRLQALSRSGHSRAFDAAADGYLRGEGCGVVTLRRLTDAERDGDAIIGVVCGSSIGHNGISSGLTAPSPQAQERVIRQALARARLAPADISYLEAHGTGTELGDPIEIQAAAAALGGERDSQTPLLVGSVKTNIGHLEAAAGMAGLIKVLLSIEQGRIPGQLNFDEPNPHIPWERLPVRVLTEATAWPDPERRIAGVSAFGMSGTNAHAIIAAHSAGVRGGTGPRTFAVTTSPSPPDLPTTKAGPHLVVLSGRTEEALQELAWRYAHRFEDEPRPSLEDVAFTLATGRVHFEHRAAVVVHDARAALSAFRAVARGSAHDGVIRGQGRRAPKIAWQFTGQGAQYPGMARGLYEREAVFRQAIDDCEELLRGRRKGSLKNILFDHPDGIHDTNWTQPAIFAVQMGLVKLLQNRGLQPDVVLGHSVGQYAAACVAGIMDWDEGLLLISERGRLIGELPAGGAMSAVFASPADAERELEADGGGAVSVAAVNGTHVVISGPRAAVEEAETRFERRNIRCRRLRTSHAFHSSLMEPALGAFRNVADGFRFRKPRIPLICNRTGSVLKADAQINGEYWASHIRLPVRYADSIESARELGCEVLLEIGPDAVLTRMASASWTKSGDSLVSCLQQGSEDVASLLQAIGRLYARGAEPDFQAMYAGEDCRRIVLPTYPFQRRRFWGPERPKAAYAERHTEHPLLGRQLSLAGREEETRYEQSIEPDRPAWLPDHNVMGHVVLPGAAYLEMALTAARSARIENLRFEQPLQTESRTVLQTVVRGNGGGARTIEVFAAVAGTAEWKRHFHAEIAAGDDSPELDRVELNHVELDRLREGCPETADPEQFYQRLQDIGLDYGPAFRTVRELHYGADQVLARIQCEDDLRGFTIPPTLLDGVLHALAVGLLKGDAADLFLPVGMGAVQCCRPVDRAVWSHARWTGNDGALRTADLTLFTEDGDVVAVIRELRLQRIDRAGLRRMSGAAASGLIYDLTWHAARLSDSVTHEKRWLIVRAAIEDPAADATRDALVSRGHAVVEIQLDCHDGQSVEFRPVPGVADADEADAGKDATRAVLRIPLDGRVPEQWEQALDGLSQNEVPFLPDGIIWMLREEQSPGKEPAGFLFPVERNCTGLLNLVHALHERDGQRLECGLLLVTENAMATAAGASCRPGQSLYWGLGRVLGGERPELRCRLVDLESVATRDEAAVDTLLEILLAETSDSQFAIRNGRAMVPRLARAEVGARRRDEFSARGDASYLITGGLGALGRLTAKWLAERGAGQLVLVSRRNPDEAVRESLKDIEETGCEVIFHCADLISREEVERLFARFGDDLAPLAGVIHAAGILDDDLIGNQTWERFEQVLAPKVLGAGLLDEFTRSLPLDFFLMYSSAASVLGSPGQSNYAAANAYLDGLGWQRRAAGLPAASINWGPWTAGMASDERIARRLELQGITPLTPDAAHTALEHILAAGLVQASVLDIDWRRMLRGLGSEPPALLAGLAPARRDAAAGDSAFVGRLKRLQGRAQRELLTEMIQGILQRILGTPSAPETDRPLIELGLDSLMAVELTTKLQETLGEGFTVAPTMLFDHPTIDAITDYVIVLVDAVPDSSGNSEPAVEGTPARPAAAGQRSIDREPIAIIGMSCRFPGARDVEEFWQNLLAGVDSVREVPGNRWDIDRFYDAERGPGKMYSREGGFLDDIADFDAAFFDISDQEACWIDPQHRLLLENSYRALEDAGIPSRPVKDANVGVFMGMMGSDYAFLPSLDDEHIIRAFQGAGLSHSAGVGRISHFFGFEGPGIAIDTASSSSLVALDQAVRSLQNGQCNLALAGGVNAILAPVNSLLLSRAGLLSPDGRCKSFSAAADGFGRGEGCGVLVLKRLSDAERDQDRILAVVRGSAVVHNGAVGGITSPNGRSQTRVINAALREAKIAPSQVQYLEAHGTGTEFGDPIELNAAAAAYSKGRQPGRPLLVGSVKANIGHLEAAGGVSGVIKAVLALQHGVIPPQVHFDQPSPHVRWQRLPLEVVSTTTPWPETEERIAGVTALGLAGTNAHVILSAAPAEPIPSGNQEHRDGRPLNPESSHQLLVLSGKTSEGLTDVVQTCAEFLSDEKSPSLSDVCCTAAVGRRHFDFRLALTASSKEEAARRLAEWGRSGGAELRSDCVSAGVAAKSSQLAWRFSAEGPADQTALELYHGEPAFRRMVELLDQRLRADESSPGRTSLSLEDWLTGHPAANDAAALDNDTKLFVLQTGLAAIWKSWGLEPDACLGMGIGQYAAACVAGVLSFEDALLLVVRRREVLEHPTDESLDRFEQFADGLNYYPPKIPLVCSLTGGLVPGHRSLGGSYWRQHVTAEAKPAESSGCLAREKCDVVLEFGPSPDLPANSMPEAIATYRTDEHPGVSLRRALGRLYTLGFEIDFEAVHENAPRRIVRLPHYPFRRSRYWITELSREEPPEVAATRKSS